MDPLPPPPALSLAALRQQLEAHKDTARRSEKDKEKLSSEASSILGMMESPREDGEGEDEEGGEELKVEDLKRRRSILKATQATPQQTADRSTIAHNDILYAMHYLAQTQEKLQTSNKQEPLDPFDDGLFNPKKFFDSETLTDGDGLFLAAESVGQTSGVLSKSVQQQITASKEMMQKSNALMDSIQRTKSTSVPGSSPSPTPPLLDDEEEGSDMDHLKKLYNGKSSHPPSSLDKIMGYSRAASPPSPSLSRARPPPPSSPAPPLPIPSDPPSSTSLPTKPSRPPPKPSHLTIPPLLLPRTLPSSLLPAYTNSLNSSASRSNPKEEVAASKSGSGSAANFGDSHYFPHTSEFLAQSLPPPSSSNPRPPTSALPSRSPSPSPLYRPLSSFSLPSPPPLTPARSFLPTPTPLPISPLSPSFTRPGSPIPPSELSYRSTSRTSHRPIHPSSHAPSNPTTPHSTFTSSPPTPLSSFTSAPPTPLPPPSRTTIPPNFPSRNAPTPALSLSIPPHSYSTSLPPTPSVSHPHPPSTPSRPSSFPPSTPTNITAAMVGSLSTREREEYMERIKARNRSAHMSSESILDRFFV